MRSVYHTRYEKPSGGAPQIRNFQSAARGCLSTAMRLPRPCRPAPFHDILRVAHFSSVFYSLFFIRMRIEQRQWTSKGGWRPVGKTKVKSADLVLIFGSNGIINDSERYNEAAEAFPGARIVSGSTAGEILGTT